ncbi:dihydrolipoyl dehydrogenase [Mycobacterium servetii]|uniref:Dihydrolipoyl dehydrogenase n=1 Tax=Mycobacterium servetii TaxID=3237418 RepID=A0ABV4C642_9MYCO
MDNVDVLTIGAGGGGYPAAFRLAAAGRRVVMVDPKGVMSGNCLAEGCVPSKAVREIAHHLLRHRRFQKSGLHGDVSVDYSEVVAHKDQVQTRRYEQHDAELRAAPNVALLTGTARIEDPHTVAVDTPEGLRRFTARNIIVASGSDISVPPIPGLEHCLSSRDLYALHPSLSTLPSSMLVIGGGYVGLETASFFSAFGCRVTVFEREAQLLPGMDPDMVAQLVPLLDPNIDIILQAEVRRVEPTSQGVRVVFFDGTAEQHRSAQQAFQALGRHPVIPAGLREIGVTIGAHGVQADPTLQTNLRHIYACGDVNGRTPLFHAAVRQSVAAAANILAGDHHADAVDFLSTPTTVFTLPAAAYVGLTRASAAAAGISIEESAYSFAEDSRAQIFGETQGEIRLFFQTGSLRLVGGWVVGIDAGNLIGQIGLAVSRGLDARDLAAFADQHPMSAEGISRAARSLF